MNTAILMAENEPADKELSELMKEVAAEAKRKAVESQNQLQATVKQLPGLAVQKQ
ncbi:MAG: hypothetical protein ABIX01_14975 [Chitinophagaceae bacterium]